MRYAAEDDFGMPETEFLVCRFWLIDALAALGRRVAEVCVMFTQAVLGMVLLSHVSAAWTVPFLALLSGSAARSLDQGLS